MNELCFHNFHNHQMRAFRRDDGIPCIITIDLCRILGLRNTTEATRRLEDHQKGFRETETLGGKQALAYVTESGMWMLVLRSNKKEAVEIQQWLSCDVLPALRVDGSYTLPGHEAPEAALPTVNDLAQYRADLDAVALMRRMAGNGAALGLWAKLGLPLPDGFGTPAQLDDGLAAAIETWIEGRDRFTNVELGNGIGLYQLDLGTKRRMADILQSRGWVYKQTRFSRENVQKAWHRPPMKSAAPRNAEGEIIQ